MKLLGCHIDNFGKLTDYTMDFTENPQVFYAPNGWGKSTLAAFIKVMFYGFAGEGKRGATLEKERLRYKPWQGGVYGGEITFEAGGKTYLLNRTFGNKEAEDSFALYDGLTGLKSEDYTVNIGEELFQINQESFLRTVFLGQNDSATFATDSINAKIGNLADNLDDMNNYEKVQQVLKDLRNSMSPTRKTGSLKKQKEAIAELKEELRKAGAIEAAMAEIENKLIGCQEEKGRLTREKAALQEKWEALTRRRAVEAKKAHYDSILNQCTEKQERMTTLLAFMGGSLPEKEAVVAMQEQYRLCQEKESEAKAYALEEQEARELDRLQACFVEGVPSGEQLQAGREQLKHLEELRLWAARKCLDENENAEKERLEELFGLNGDNLEERELRLETLEQNLEDGLRHVSTYMEHKNGLGAKRATLSSLKMLQQQQKLQREQSLQKLKEQLLAQRKAYTAALWVLIAGVALFIAGGVMWGAMNRQAGIALLCAGAVAVIMGGILLLSGRRRAAALSEAEALAAEPVEAAEGEVDLLEAEIAKDEEHMAANRDFVAAVLADIEECNAVDSNAEDWYADSAWEDPLYLRDVIYGHKDDVKHLKRFYAKEADYQAADFEGRMAELQKQVAAVLMPYYGEVSTAELTGCLGTLAEEKDRFGVLDDRQKKARKAREEAAVYRQQVSEFLVQHSQGESDLYEGLQSLSDCIGEYEKATRDFNRLQAEKTDFEKTNDVSIFEQTFEGIEESDETLKNCMNELEAALLLTDEQIHGYRRQLEDRQAENEELALQREKLAQAEADLEKDTTYYDRIGHVSTYLERAKESLSAKYIGPIQESFKRHYELLAGEPAVDFRMDANLQVRRRAMGELRETGAFSAGNRDLTAIVLRIALVEAMYQKEKPFLVIDDSFVNLDGERLKTAGKFMEQIAKEYQVIYFTCHESRVWTE